MSIINVIAPDGDVQAYTGVPVDFSLTISYYLLDGVIDSHLMGFDYIPLDSNIFGYGASSAIHFATFAGVTALSVSDFAVI